MNDGSVLSEVHVTTETPAHFDSDDPLLFVTPVSFTTRVLTDDDGDCICPRSESLVEKRCFQVVHRLQTDIVDVGFQMWSGSFLLAEFLWHNAERYSEETCLELGSGTGLLGIVAATLMRRVFLTDYTTEILRNCRCSISLNPEVVSVARVRLLDLADRETYPNSLNVGFERNAQAICETSKPDSDSSFSWTDEDERELAHVKFFLAADLTYDADLTDALVRFMEDVLTEGRTLLLTIEKRINFTNEVVAEAYDYLFRTKFTAPSNARGDASSELVEVRRDTKRGVLEGVRIPIDFPRYTSRYERTPQLELWSFTCTTRVQAEAET